MSVVLLPSSLRFLPPNIAPTEQPTSQSSELPRVDHVLPLLLATTRRPQVVRLLQAFQPMRPLLRHAPSTSTATAMASPWDTRLLPSAIFATAVDRRVRVYCLCPPFELTR